MIQWNPDLKKVANVPQTLSWRFHTRFAWLIIMVGVVDKCSPTYRTALPSCCGKLEFTIYINRKSMGQLQDYSSNSAVYWKTRSVYSLSKCLMLCFKQHNLRILKEFAVNLLAGQHLEVNAFALYVSLWIVYNLWKNLHLYSTLY